MSLQWSPDENPTCDPTPSSTSEVTRYGMNSRGDLYVIATKGTELKTDPLPITKGSRWVDYALIIGCLILLRVVWGIFAGVFPID